MSQVEKLEIGYEVEEGYRLSPQQARLWTLLGEGHDLPSPYGAHCVVGIEGELDLDRLARAFGGVVARHEILRTGFRRLAGATTRVQVIADHLEVPLEHHDGASAEDLADRARGWPQEPLDRVSGPLLRAGVARRGAHNHLLVIALPALCTDRQGLVNLVSELAAEYERPGANGEEPVQYADVAEWQNELLEQEGAAQGRRFWQTHGRRAAAPVFRLQQRVASERRFEPASRAVRLDAETSRRVERAAAAARTPDGLRAFYLAAWQCLLGRLEEDPQTGPSEITVGVAFDGRRFDELKAALGLFVRFLPVTVELGNHRFDELLETARATLEVTADWQDYFVRDGAARETFEPYLFELETAGSDPPFQLGDSRLTFEEVAWVGERFKLLLAVRPEPAGHTLRLDFDSVFFAPAAAETILERLRILLSAVTASPATGWRQLDILGEKERRRLLELAAGPVAPALVRRKIHELVADQVAATPEATSLVAADRHLSYGDLWRRSGALADRLRKAGVVRGTPVALHLERSPEMIIALLGILRAGGAWVALDPELPAERIAFLIQDSRAEVVVTRSAEAPLPEAARRLARVLVEVSGGVDPVPEAPSFSVELDPDDLAYILYTSGSTGQPKGVAVSHGAICNRMLWMLHAGLVEDRDVVLQKTPLGFDASIWEVFVPLLCGGKAVLAAPGEEKDPAALCATLYREQVRVLQFVPSLLKVFLDQPELDRDVPLRRLFCGGEALSQDLRRRVTERLGVEVHNLYGPTEVSIDATHWPCGTGSAGTATIEPIGPPIANVGAHVTDRRLELVGMGSLGEVCVAGVGLARGYASNPRATAERFVPHPWSDEPGCRLYRTGDLATVRLDGALDFLGRADRQVKIRGVRVEPREVEAALHEHPRVREAVVVVREDEDGYKRLVAYLVARRESVAEAAPAEPDRSQLDPAEMRRFLEERLPAHLVPSAIVEIEGLPRLPSGKIDPRALPPPADLKPRRPYVAPRDARETILAEIWSELLGHERVGVDESFFELGGDSILSLRMITRARRAGLSLTVQQLFEHPTVARLASVVEEIAPAPTRAEVDEVRSGPIALTPAMCRFFQLDLGKDQHHFHQTLLFETQDPVHPVALGNALGRLVRHHDALRLRFERHNGEWQARIVAEVADPTPGVVDLSALPPERVPAALTAAATRVQASFDLGRPPLIAATVFDLGAERGGRLLVVGHHLVVDGVSWRVLLEDLERVYSALLAGRTAPLPPPTTALGTWVEALVTAAGSSRAGEELERWLEFVPDSHQPLPTDHPRRSGANREASDSVTVSLLTEKETQALLREVPAALGTRINEVLLAALFRSLAEWSGAASLTVDLEGHGREAPTPDLDASRTVGWLTMVHPVVVDTRQVSDPLAAVRAVKDTLLRIPERGRGFDLLRFLRPGAAERLAALPKAEVSFNYHGQLDPALEGSSLLRPATESPGPSRSPRAERAYLIEIDSAVNGGRLQVGWSFSRDLHDASTIEALGAGFVDGLRRLIDLVRERPTAALATATLVPGDFPAARLSRQDLDRLIARYGERLEDVFILTPVQEGMLFQTLRAPGQGSYCSQISYTLEGELDLERLRRAWRQVLDQLPGLRAAFVWQELDVPHQVVVRDVEIPLQELDWRPLPPAEQEERFESLRVDDQRQGFEPSEAPLMRLRWIRLADDVGRVLLSSHHILMDGWSVPRVLRAVLEAYDRPVESVPVDPGLSFRRFLAWLARQDTSGAEEFWRRRLRGVQAPTRLGIERPPETPTARPPGFEELPLGIETATAEALDALARRQGLTLATVVQGAWAILLSRYSRQTDLLYGVTVSGRPPTLERVDEMIGVFINTLPMRVEVEPLEPLLSWLASLQANNVEALRYQHSSLVEIRRWSDVPPGVPLFETIFVFENFPAVEALSSESSGQLNLTEIWSAASNHYPFTMRGHPETGLVLTALHDRRRFEEEDLRRLLSHMGGLLRSMVAQPQARLEALKMFTSAEESQVVEKEKTRRKKSFSKFKSVAPQQVRVSSERLVRERFLDGLEGFPLVIEASMPDVDLVDWASGHRSMIEERLHRHGAILLRGFGVASGDELERFATAICDELYEEYGDLPSHGDTSRIYGATPYPPEQTILFHNEASHTHQWPLKQMFYCVEPAPSGGDSGIVDGRRVYRALEPELRDQFERRGLKYVRSFIEGLDVRWQDFFRVEDRSEVEAYCARAGIDCEWLDDGSLRISHRAPAVASHPVTGEKVWFNQLQLHHISCVDAETRASLCAIYPLEKLPRNVYFGDGESITDEVMARVSEVLDQESVTLRLEKEDVLLVDNMLVAHARYPYEGPRKILVAMGDPMNSSENLSGGSRGADGSKSQEALEAVR